MSVVPGILQFVPVTLQFVSGPLQFVSGTLIYLASVIFEVDLFENPAQYCHPNLPYHCWVGEVNDNSNKNVGANLKVKQSIDKFGIVLIFLSFHHMP